MTNHPRRFRLTLRTKFLLLTPILLTIPFVGYQYVQEMESYLREGLENAVLGAARALAGALNDRAELFQSSGMETGPQAGDIYVHPLRQPVEVDGYTADWAGHQERARPLQPFPSDPSLDNARYVSGKFGNYLYFLLQVKDQRLIYREPGDTSASQADHVVIRVSESGKSPRRYVLSTISPGNVVAEVFEQGVGNGRTSRTEYRVKGHWRRSSEGYVLEVRFPLSLAGDNATLSVLDVDTPNVRATRYSSGPKDRHRELGRLVFPSPQLEGLIRGLERTRGRRTWVVDRDGRVIARGGSLARPATESGLNPLYGLILAPPSTNTDTDDAVVSTLSGPEVRAAIDGNPKAGWNPLAGDAGFLVTAAHPIYSEDKIVGAVVVEEATTGIQTVRRQALANLFNKTLLVCLAGGLTLLLFASRTTSRLRRLRDQAEESIDQHGRVSGQFDASGAGDEIGDLSRSMASMMERLRQYTEYLEQLASRLSHELRTPLAVVGSSLDNLRQAHTDDERATYAERAQGGLERLQTILTSMSEAARLEQALASTDKEDFDLNRVIHAAAEAYRSTWPDLDLKCEFPGQPVTCRGAPDLLVQLLDKLVANAREFGRVGEPVLIAVSLGKGPHVRLEVSNHGPLLPAAMQGKLFQSMVSVRQGGRGPTPHLGLGLYVVRLIAEFHGGHAAAANLSDGSGVRVWVELPTLGS